MWHGAKMDCNITPQRAWAQFTRWVFTCNTGCVCEPPSPSLPAMTPLPPSGCPALLTAQGCGRSPGSGHRGLRRQEWAASSAVGSRTPWRLRRSLLASPSKSPHSPATRPWKWGDSCTSTRVPGGIIKSDPQRGWGRKTHGYNSLLAQVPPPNRGCCFPLLRITEKINTWESTRNLSSLTNTNTN